MDNIPSVNKSYYTNNCHCFEEFVSQADKYHKIIYFSYYSYGGYLFNIELFDMKLNTEYIGRTFVYAEEIESTNSFLLNKESGYRQDGTVVLAEKQTKGRGRKERTWSSAPELNLTFSILLTKKNLFRNINFVNLASSLSVSTSLENLYQLKTELKWPNDVLINGKKTCGILLESSSVGSEIERLVVGIGINVNQSSFQGTFNYPPTSIRNELNRNVDRERLLAELLNNFETNIQLIKSEKDQLLNDWKAKCRMIGERISIVDDDKEKFGIFEDIDENGFLILKTKDGLEKIHYGDVSVRI